MKSMNVPFFRVEISEAERCAVDEVLKSGWLTTGPTVNRFEEAFRRLVGAEQSLALTSATAAMHLAVEALGLSKGDAVLVPTMTFAATAEVVRYQGAIPVLVDCDPVTGNMDLDDAADKLEATRSGRLPRFDRAQLEGVPSLRVVGIMPVHVGGLMMSVDCLRRFAAEHHLWIVEDAAHAFPSAWRANENEAWRRCGEGTADVTCYSFYANKTITTGEGGMAVTDRRDLAERMKIMALHGLSRDAWGRYSGGPWDYRIVAPGYKYNLTDIQAALGVEQLKRAEEMRLARETQANRYSDELCELPQLEIPPPPGPNRVHSWHLYPVKLRLNTLGVDRDRFVSDLKESGVGFSVHWRPLHLHPYYAETFGWMPEDLPIATQEWVRQISLPIFPSMTEDEQSHVIDVIKSLCTRHAL